MLSRKRQDFCRDRAFSASLELPKLHSGSFQYILDFYPHVARALGLGKHPSLILFVVLDSVCNVDDFHWMILAVQSFSQQAGSNTKTNPSGRMEAAAVENIQLSSKR